MSANLEDIYFDWLCALAGLSPPQGSSYYLLGKILHKTAFYSILGNDDNRGTDGKSLRFYFCKDLGVKQSDGIAALDGPCSVLEMLLGLSIKIDGWLTGESFGGKRLEGIRFWFWLFIDNLSLQNYTDQAICQSGQMEQNARASIMKMLDRSYDKNGNGSLFPVVNGQKDMRKIEIWAQFNEYLKENPDLIFN